MISRCFLPRLSSSFHGIGLALNLVKSSIVTSHVKEFGDGRKIPLFRTVGMNGDKIRILELVTKNRCFLVKLSAGMQFTVSRKKKNSPNFTCNQRE